LDMLQRATTGPRCLSEDKKLKKFLR